jgi:Transcriptional regulator, AbiEi antitoxin, Type IV TA system/Transcriptional regulator, AbiEi antitoxin N-terminal domain
MVDTSLNTMLPLGVPTTRKWLLAQGVAGHRLDNNLKSGKLIALAPAVYMRAGLPVNWQGLVFGLQRLYPQGVLGGLSALESQGFGHFVQMASAREIHFYAPQKAPAWLPALRLGCKLVWHKNTSLWQLNLTEMSDSFSALSWRDDLPSLSISCVEKAFLELLADVPASVSFDHADALMQGMTSLSPTKLKYLLQACTNVKVKRLFFWLANRYQYPWLKKLNVKEFYLGSGNRVIAKEGKLDNQFHITVPEHLYGR